ncbi:MAG: hypothetical protein WBE34_14235 [Candidatus Nitrosopolaris sp.]
MLGSSGNMARFIADSVWSTSGDIRDCVRIGKIARSVEDVRFIVENLISYGGWKRG